jgi:hypothetical protein
MKRRELFLMTVIITNRKKNTSNEAKNLITKLISIKGMTKTDNKTAITTISSTTVTEASRMKKDISKETKTKVIRMIDTIKDKHLSRETKPSMNTAIRTKTKDKTLNNHSATIMSIPTSPKITTKMLLLLPILNQINSTAMLMMIETELILILLRVTVNMSSKIITIRNKTQIKQTSKIIITLKMKTIRRKRTRNLSLKLSLK